MLMNSARAARGQHRDRVDVRTGRRPEELRVVPGVLADGEPDRLTRRTSNGSHVVRRLEVAGLVEDVVGGQQELVVAVHDRGRRAIITAELVTPLPRRRRARQRETDDDPGPGCLRRRRADALEAGFALRGRRRGVRPGRAADTPTRTARGTRRARRPRGGPGASRRARARRCRRRPRRWYSAVPGQCACGSRSIQPQSRAPESRDAPFTIR